MAGGLEALHHALAELVKLYQFRSGDERLYYGVSVGQSYCMRALWLGGPQTMGALAADLGVGLSTMTGIVDQLVELRLARRVGNPRDGRSWRVELTARGRRLHERGVAEFNARLGDVAGRYSSAELTRIAAFLDELRGVIARWMDEGRR